MKKYIVELTSEERSGLKDIIKAERMAAHKRRHAHILLKADQGPQGPAWKDADIAKAGYLFGGMPAHEAEEKFGNLNVVQIISIDEPVLSENPRGYRICCSVELNRDGQIVEWQPKGPFIRQVEGKPHRWIIVGGI